jgi:SAM-dependent methyltransferase
VLTADYDRLGLRPGDRLLDLGCGFGRHAFEALRRGAAVVAADMSTAELQSTDATFAAMADAGGLPPRVVGQVVQADALALPFASGSFDRVIAAEVLEHIAEDGAALAELVRVLRPGGTIAVTVPSFWPERVCWALSAEYHAPLVEGGHLRIYNRRVLVERLCAAGLRPLGWHRAHALHSPYWWLRCAVGPHNEGHPAVRGYRRFLEWDIMTAPRVTRTAERWLNPLLGKSLVAYAAKPDAARPATHRPDADRPDADRPDAHRPDADREEDRRAG